MILGYFRWKSFQRLVLFMFRRARNPFGARAAGAAEPAQKGNEKAKAPLCRGSDAAGPRLQPLSYAFCHGDRTQLGGKGCNLLDRERAKKGFQYYFGFAEAGVEVIVETIETLPAIGRLNGKALTEVFGGLIELANDMLDCVG